LPKILRLGNEKKSKISFCISLVFLYLCPLKAVARSVAGANLLSAGRVERERKVRAAQDAPLVKMPAIGDSRIRKKKTTARRKRGKGEKAV